MGTIDDDRSHYRIRSIESDLGWLAKTVRDSPEGVGAIASSEERRRDLRKMLLEIQKHVRSIQDKMGPEFTSEF